MKEVYGSKQMKSIFCFLELPSRNPLAYAILSAVVKGKIFSVWGILLNFYSQLTQTSDYWFRYSEKITQTHLKPYTIKHLHFLPPSPGSTTHCCPLIWAPLFKPFPHCISHHPGVCIYIRWGRWFSWTCSKTIFKIITSANWLEPLQVAASPVEGFQPAAHHLLIPIAILQDPSVNKPYCLFSVLN